MRAYQDDPADSLSLVDVAIGSQYSEGQRYPIRRFYDDGYGPVWIYRDASGLIGIVRARTWEDAYSICEDVIFDDADPADLAEYHAAADVDPDNAQLPEGMGYRNNGADPQRAWCQTGIYQTDLNGSALDRLTGQLIEDLRLILVWEGPE